MSSSLTQKLKWNILSSLFEKGIIILSQFVSSIIMIRLLARDDIGIMGVVAGIFTFLQLINISLDSILTRDHLSLNSLQTKDYIQNCFSFNLIKSTLLIFLAIIVGSICAHLYHNSNFIYATLSYVIIISVDSLVSPFATLKIATLEQKTVTKLSFIRFSLNLLLMLGLLIYPTLEYLLFKDLFVAVVFLLLWYYHSRSLFPSKVFISYDFVKSKLVGYSLWVHLIGVCTNLIYRSDLFFLSLFSPLGVVGNYNVALNCGNVANIIPSILGQQNAVAISNTHDNSSALNYTTTFIRFSLYIGVATWLLFYFFGAYYVTLVTGDASNGDIPLYLLLIVSALIIVKTIASPFVGYINMRGDVRSLFFRVNLPTLIITMTTYFFSAYYIGPMGVAVGNIIIAIFWSILLVIEMKKYGYSLKMIRGFKNDYMRIKKACFKSL